MASYLTHCPHCGKALRGRPAKEPIHVDSYKVLQLAVGESLYLDVAPDMLERMRSAIYRRAHDHGRKLQTRLTNKGLKVIRRA